MDSVVSLLEKDGELEVGLSEEHASCIKSEIEFESFPIPDGGVRDTDKARAFVRKLHYEIVS